MPTDEAVLLYVTADNKEEALEIGRTLVQEKLVACANILDNMTSVFSWQGRVSTGQEAVLLLKTSRRRVEEVTARITDLHSYEVPCVVALTASGGNEEFLSWILESCQPPE